MLERSNLLVNDTLPKSMIWAKLEKGVIMYDEEVVVKAAEDVLMYGLDIYESIMNGLVPGIEKVGALYESGEYFVNYK